MNRETYLDKSVIKLSKLFKKAGYDLPPVHVSCSWPGGAGKKKGTIGQCFPKHMSKGKINEIFISPVIEDAVEVLEIVVHELIHAIDDCKHKHRKEFIKIMKDMGLEGKPTATHAGKDLKADLVVVAKALGKYPHSKLTIPKKKSGTNGGPTKITCNDCGCTWRMSPKWTELLTCCPACQSEEGGIG